MVVKCRNKVALTQYKEKTLFNVRIDEIDLLISETIVNCETYFHSLGYNVQIGGFILKIKKNGRFKKRIGYKK